MTDRWRLVREKPGPPGSMVWQWFRLYVAMLHLWREVGRTFIGDCPECRKGTCHE